MSTFSQWYKEIGEIAEKIKSQEELQEEFSRPTDTQTLNLEQSI